MQRSYDAGSALMQRVETIQLWNNPESGNLEELSNFLINQWTTAEFCYKQTRIKI